MGEASVAEGSDWLQVGAVLRQWLSRSSVLCGGTVHAPNGGSGRAWEGEAEIAERGEKLEIGASFANGAILVP